MINCQYCCNLVFKYHPLVLYCSQFCVKKFNNKKNYIKRKSDPVRRAKYRDSERKRRRLKYHSDPAYRAQRLGKEFDRRMKNNPNAKPSRKGLGTINKNGYRQITVPSHPNAWRTGAMFEHVFVMSQFLGRPLYKNERVHHKNGVKHDNRIENLELWSKSHPYGQRVEDKIKWCIELLDTYGFDVIKRS